MMHHGVSGFPVLGRAGDFDIQHRGEPLENIVNDPVESYLNAQNHIGVPMSNFNESWHGGILADWNYNAQPYPKALWSEPLVGPPGPTPQYQKVVGVEYPSLIGDTFPQQLPTSRLAPSIMLPALERQNMGFESGTANGDNKVFMPPTSIHVKRNTIQFQGSETAPGVHPNNDKAGQQTTGNTGRTDFTGGQAPYQKLPNGLSVATLQPNDAPQLWELAPPPDPPVLPGEGTQALQSTVPQWW